MSKKVNRNIMNQGTDMHKRDVYNRAMIPCLPWLPFAGRDSEPQPSELLGKLLEDTKWPKLILSHKHTFEYYKPSEFIGFAYTPSVNILRVQNMPPRRKEKRKDNPYFQNNRLISPPRITPALLEEREQRRLERKRKKELKVSGIVQLEDLLNGEHWRRKDAQEKKRIDARERKKRKIQEEKRIAEEKVLMEIEKMSAIEPIHPDVQKFMLLEQTEIEQTRIIRPEDIEKIIYYTSIGIDEIVYITPYPEEYFDRIKKQLKPHFKELFEYVRIMQACKRDVKEGYIFALKCAIFDYVLHDPVEKKRLGIVTYPAQYRPNIICAPVPWHSTYTAYKHIISQDLFCNSIVIREIRDLWEREYVKLIRMK